MLMKTILVTGAKGFVGRNLCRTLAQISELTVLKYDVDSTPEELEQALQTADVIFHLAGVNRPSNTEEFKTGNADFTTSLCDRLLSLRRTPLLILSSSVQASLDNPYGHSKRLAEQAVETYAQSCAALRSGTNPESRIQNPKSRIQNPESKIQNPELSDCHSPLPSSASPRLCVSNSPFALIYRFPNVFGKGCRPNYNSAVATWCHNFARGLPIQVRDPSAPLTLVYVDDVVNEFLSLLSPSAASASPCLCVYKDIAPTYTRTLGQITDLIHAFKESRATIQVPDQGDEFSKKLYATYLSALPEDQFAYPLKMNTDARGSFTEFLKTPDRGQVSVNVSKPGIVKGNHWHHTKVEKFLVVSGKGVIRFRKIGEEIRNSELRILNLEESRLQQAAVSNKQANIDIQNSESKIQNPKFRIQNPDFRGREAEKIIEYHASGEKLEVIDIPPGYTHNIENVGDTDMVTVMWASEPFDPERPDTFFEKV